ncbi:PE family protein [Mycobacterium servetii]|uniref:PE-PPE domain-containing protein n=1 Tax=Mycobacterium servetii TaxID=3237418 RepID=A0ABV4CCL5_9MYCO
MSLLIAAPDALASTTADVERIGAAINAAGARAAVPTTSMVAAAEDEVSAAIARLFGAYAEQSQALLAQAADFHSRFAQALAAAGNSYAEAESVDATLLGRSALAAGTPTGTVTFASTLPSLPVTALIMGGAHNPGPVQYYIDEVNTAYIQPLISGANPKGVFTPEQFWPITPELGNTLTFGQSVTQGVTLLNTAIDNQIALGNNALVLGYSESAAVATNEINALLTLPTAAQPGASQLAFLLLGDPNNPVGGILERFTGFYVPLLDVPFNGATPQSPWHTSIYTIQYDGIADFPQYPLNLVSDLNAAMGLSLHADYPLLTADQVANAVPLPTSGGNTDYYMILSQNLPLLGPIRDYVPYVGNALADLVQPDLRVLVDLGYADYGPGGNYANVPTPAGLFEIPNPFTVIPDLGTGAVQGVQAAMVDLGYLPPSALPTTYPYAPALSPHLNVFLGQPSTTLLSTITGAVGPVLHLIPPVTDLPQL